MIAKAVPNSDSAASVGSVTVFGFQSALRPIASHREQTDNSVETIALIPTLSRLLSGAALLGE